MPARTWISETETKAGDTHSSIDDTYFNLGTPQHLEIMAYFHRPCESYFVESHDDHRIRSYESERRERKKQTDLYTQNAIASELSQLVSEDYRDDIVQHMEKMEVISPNDYGALLLLIL